MPAAEGAGGRTSALPNVQLAECACARTCMQSNAHGAERACGTCHRTGMQRIWPNVHAAECTCGRTYARRNEHVPEHTRARTCMRPNVHTAHPLTFTELHQSLAPRTYTRPNVHAPGRARRAPADIYGTETWLCEVAVRTEANVCLSATS